jgi:hypothetical protein
MIAVNSVREGRFLKKTIFCGGFTDQNAVKINWKMKRSNLRRFDIFRSVFTIPSRPDSKKRGAQFWDEIWCTLAKSPHRPHSDSYQNIPRFDSLL